MSNDQWGWGNDHDPGQPPPYVPPPPSWDAPGPGPPSAWSSTLDELASRSSRERARMRARRRLLIAAVVAVLVVVAGAVTTVVIVTTTGSRGSDQSGGASGWCATGTTGAVTTVSGGGDQKTPVGAVSMFLSAVIDDRSATDARAVMSDTAVNPTAAQLQQWISTVPSSTSAWCAQITTTDSTARLLVDLRLRAGRDSVQVGQKNTFYVSESTPGRWAIDAIVADDGTRP